MYSLTRILRAALVLPLFVSGLALGASAVVENRTQATPKPTCTGDDSGLRLPAGFCATVFADHIGHARHLVIASDGVVYVNTWSGVYFANDTPHAGGFVVALQDTTGTGKANVERRFGETAQTGGAGGTGIGLFRGNLYVESNDKLVRYLLAPGSVVPNSEPQTIVSGLPLTGDHPMHPFLIDSDGSIFVDVASETNACQSRNRMLESPGAQPCTELLTRGGIWRYSADTTGQVFSPAGRYATGIRNGEGFALDPVTHRLYVTQHGRDQLHSNWPAFYSMEQEATLPAEELLLLQADHDYGWPECYYDPVRAALVLAPEYGGDGKKIGSCSVKTGPVASFPAHWAPDGMVYYDKGQFPERYRDGVFIAFHGSWNRAPYAQHGYNVVFQSLPRDGTPGRCEVFADGFAGAITSPEKAAHRPTGIAVGPDGALFVSDDVSGRIYRISYQGGPGTRPEGGRTVPCPSATEPAGPVVPVAVHGTSHAADAASLAVPDGATREMVLLGEQIYRGQVGGATCTGCHGASATGTPLGPNLAAGRWLWSDGTFAGLAATIRIGVSHPMNYRAPMPAMGGAQLTADQVSAVAAYLWALSQPPIGGDFPKLISIPGQRVYPESITATSDGRLIIGSISKRELYEVKPGADIATPWIAADGETTLGVFGVYAEEASGTLWACYSEFPGSTGSPQAPSALVAYDLVTGRPKARFVLPTPKAFCNDIASAADGSIYVTDTNNMEVDRLAKGDTRLRPWIGGGIFGPDNAVLDGISVVGSSLIVSTLATSKVFSIPITGTGAAGTVTELTLSRPIAEPDGMRVLGNTATLITETGGAGRLSRLDFSGDQVKVTTLKEGFTDSPVSVAVVGTKAYVLEGQLNDLYGPQGTPTTTRAFKVTAIDLPAVD